MVYVGLVIAAPVLYNTVTLALSPGLRLVTEALYPPTATVAASSTVVPVLRKVKTTDVKELVCRLA